ncbi:hypothetical protein B0J14DRAFT_674111 [Halenospora varia]|nr:hypothetical protein B0J14DRAFT_674111 [Halenospora varia]
MRLFNSGLLLVFVPLCCAAPAPTSSARSKTATSSRTSKVIASSQSTGKPPPVLLSQATSDQAGGGVPSGPPPQTSFSANALQNFKVANFIEGIESGFFAGALNSLNKDPNFTNPTSNGQSIANVTTQIAAQELVHKATLEGLLGLAMEPTVPACATIFPVNDTNDYLAKANVVTSAAIGVIITILQSLSQTDPNLLGPLSSILSVESQQDAFFRMSGSNTPSASPFSTSLSTTFAYNIALTFVDPRSCPQLLPLPILPSLNRTSPAFSATAPPTPPTSITFDASGVPHNGNLFVGWVNQANPVVYSDVIVQDGIGTADVPKGLTGIAFAALTAQATEMTVDGLTNVTLAGPAPVLMS